MDIRLYDMNLFTSDKWEDMKLIATTDKDIDFGGFILIKDEAYRMCAFSPKKNVMGVEKVELNIDGEEHENEENLICPFCGVEDYDSWELKEDEGETDCSSCGSEIKYQRNISIDYDSYPIKCSPTTKI